MADPTHCAYMRHQWEMNYGSYGGMIHQTCEDFVTKSERQVYELNKLQDYSFSKEVDNYYHISRDATYIPFVHGFLKVAHIQQQYV